MVSQFKIVVVVFVFLIHYPYERNIIANSPDSKAKIYFKKSTELNGEKRRTSKSTNKLNGREIKSLIKKRSITHGNKKRNYTATSYTNETGLTTNNLVKKNRWFVKKPFQKSYNKISRIKRVQRHYVDSGVNKEISLKVSKYSKTRARESRPNKVDPGINNEISLKASKYSKTRAKETGQNKPEIIYSKNSSRVAIDMAKSRARKTGPVKPEIIYSVKVSREANKMASKRNKKELTLEQNYSGQRYSAKLLKSMGRGAYIKNIDFDLETNDKLKKSNSDNVTDD